MILVVLVQIIFYVNCRLSFFGLTRLIKILISTVNVDIYNNYHAFNFRFRFWAQIRNFSYFLNSIIRLMDVH